MAPTMSRGRVAGLALAAGGLAAVAALQRAHLRRVAADPHYAELRRPLDGSSVGVDSRDGTRLHVETFGPPSEGPTVVLIHGWTERLTLWGPVIHELRSAGVRAVAFDLRGHGQSGRAVNDDYALERFGEDVEAVLAAVTPEAERSIVVGHSLGAMSIAAWAEHHDVERRARAAAMLNTGLGDLLTGHLLFGEMAARFNSRVAGRLLLGSRAPLPAFSSPLGHAAIRHAAFGPAAGTAEVAFFERMLLECDPGVRAACGVAMSDMDLQHAIARITVPTLVVAGDRDRLTPPSHARRIADALPRPAGLIEMQNTGHMSPLERPREVAALLVKLASGKAAEQATA